MVEGLWHFDFQKEKIKIADGLNWFRALHNCKPLKSRAETSKWSTLLVFDFGLHILVVVSNCIFNT